MRSDTPPQGRGRASSSGSEKKERGPKVPLGSSPGTRTGRESKLRQSMYETPRRGGRGGGGRAAAATAGEDVRRATRTLEDDEEEVDVESESDRISERGEDMNRSGTIASRASVADVSPECNGGAG